MGARRTRSRSPYREREPMSSPEESNPPQYPRPFLWGAAFSAHQTEGVKGGGESGDWYKFEHEKKGGKPTIVGGDTADRATDFWDRHLEDLQQARAIGLTTLR